VRFLLIPLGFLKYVHKFTISINSVSNIDQYNYKKPTDSLQRQSHCLLPVTHPEFFTGVADLEAICNLCFVLKIMFLSKLCLILKIMLFK
jgi:hypothetical protein